MKKFESSGYTGGVSESEVLGDADVDKQEVEREFKGEYINFSQAVDIVKGQQRIQDSTDPRKPFPNDVHATIAKKLGVDCEQVHFYTAVGSYLDKKHGVDAFFELDVGDGNVVRTTLDITQNPHKHDYKADVILHWPATGIDTKDKEDKKIWKDKVKETSEELVEFLKTEARIKGEIIRLLSEEEIRESNKIAEEKRNQRLGRVPRHVHSANLEKSHHEHAN